MKMVKNNDGRVRGLSNDKRVYQRRITKGQKTHIPYNGRSPQTKKPYSAPIKLVGKERVEIVKKKVKTQGGQDLSFVQAD